ncbi:class I tRNA ligase family protein [Streptomyces sp. NPDC060000]|uniref:class I tRNA ligase family protein n=1 Tax=Streptomyces sp. NPDC060000 TaxID=3347031 RepID=UPI003684D806
MHGFLNAPSAWAGTAPAHMPIADLESEVLQYWENNDIVREAIEPRPAGSTDFTVYDGPPCAIGVPHFGHLLAGYVKDVVPRYQTMRGRYVERRFGWTSHGLPVEMEAEKELGIRTKSDVDEIGIERFNDVCRKAIARHTGEWQEYIRRQARWVDFDKDVRTHDLNYMESVLWAFKRLWDQGLVHHGDSVSWYCGRCEAPVSKSEVSGRLDGNDTKRPVPGTTAVVGIPLDGGELLLVETDTPWALPGTAAVAVRPDADYALLESPGGRRYFLSYARVDAYRDCAPGRITAVVKGAELVGRSYRPLFDVRGAGQGAHVVIGAHHVDAHQGTGALAVTPCFSERDHAVAGSAGITGPRPADSRGRYTDDAPLCAGLSVLDAALPVVTALEERELLLRRRRHTLPRPHCRRCGTTLVEQSLPTWFLGVTRIRERMLELNQEISWRPEHIREGQYGDWVRNARDWNISRNLFWGTPIPVWISDDPAFPRIDVYGSLDELEKDFGVRPGDLHRPFIDTLTRPNPDDPSGRAVMRRVPEVLDNWFETACFPFAQVHYPFERTEWFEQNFPGDFTSEYYPQVRNWFYYLNVVSTALFDRPAFRHCTVLGVVLGDDGQAMSKARGNYLDVNEVFARHGSDALRWYLMSSKLLRAQDVAVSAAGSREALRKVVLPLWNAWRLLTLCDASAPVAGQAPARPRHVLDRYLLATTRALIPTVTAAMDSHDFAKACTVLRHQADLLANTCIRFTRARLTAGDSEAIAALRTALELLCRLMAPLLPLVTERIWCGLTGGRTVHAAPWPVEDELPADEGLVPAVSRVLHIAATALGALPREELRTGRLVVVARDAAALRPYRALLLELTEAPDVTFTADVSAYGRIRLSVLPHVAGVRLGRATRELVRAARAGQWVRDASGGVSVAGTRLRDGEYEETVAARVPGALALPDGSALLFVERPAADPVPVGTRTPS